MLLYYKIYTKPAHNKRITVIKIYSIFVNCQPSDSTGINLRSKHAFGKCIPE